MSEYILYYKNAYNVYSTVCDYPLFENAITLKQLQHYIKMRFGTAGLKLLPDRIKRAHKKNSSNPLCNSLTQALSTNHAGEKLERISTAEFIRKFLTIRETD